MGALLLAKNLRRVAREIVANAGSSEEERLGRLYGPRVADLIRSVREEVPPGGTYWIDDREQPPELAVFLRWELSPRRALLVWDPRGFSAVPPDAVARASGPEILIVPPPGVTRVIPRGARTGGKPAGVPGWPDESIPASIDRPSPGAPATDPLRVEGWCQERGGRPCEVVRFFVDGEEILPARFERVPRADVEAAVPGIGDASRAGYRAELRLPPSDLPFRRLAVFFGASGARWRLLGPVEVGGTAP